MTGVKLRWDVKLIVVPVCGYCLKLAPVCRCGRPKAVDRVERG